MEISEAALAMTLDKHGQVMAEERYHLRFCRERQQLDFVLPRPRDVRQFALRLRLGDLSTGALLLTEVGPAAGETGQAYVYETFRVADAILLRVHGQFAAGNRYDIKLSYRLPKVQPLSEQSMVFEFPGLSLRSPDPVTELSIRIGAQDEKTPMPACELLLQNDGQIRSRRSKKPHEQQLLYRSRGAEEPLAFYVLTSPEILLNDKASQEPVDLSRILAETRNRVEATRRARLWRMTGLLLLFFVLFLAGAFGLWLLARRLYRALALPKETAEDLLALPPRCWALTLNKAVLSAAILPELLGLLAAGSLRQGRGGFVIEPATKLPAALVSSLDFLQALARSQGTPGSLDLLKLQEEGVPEGAMLAFTRYRNSLGKLPMRQEEGMLKSLQTWRRRRGMRALLRRFAQDPSEGLGGPLVLRLPWLLASGEGGRLGRILKQDLGLQAQILARYDRFTGRGKGRFEMFWEHLVALAYLLERAALQEALYPSDP